MRPNVLKNFYGEIKNKKSLSRALFAAGDFLRETFPKLSLRFCIARNWDQGQLMARAGRVYQPLKFSTFWRKVRQFVPKSTALGTLAANFGYEMRTINPHTGKCQKLLHKVSLYFTKFLKAGYISETTNKCSLQFLNLPKFTQRKRHRTKATAQSK